MAADGSIVIEADLEVSPAEKSLKKLEKEISKSLDGNQDSSLNEELDKALDTAAKLEKTLHGSKSEFQYGYDKSAMEFVEQYANNIEDAKEDTNDLLMAISDTEKALKEMESGGKWLGDQEYDEAYHNLAMLNAEAKRYALELAKTPAQREKEAAAAQKVLAREEAAAKKAKERADKEAENAFEAARLNAIKEQAVVSDEKIVGLNQELVRLEERQKELKSAGVGVGYQEYDQISQQIIQINQQIKDYQKSLSAVKTQTETLSEKTSSISPAMDAMNKRVSKFSMRLREVVRSALIFTVISQGLASLREWFGKVIKTNDEATAAIGRLKGALLTLVQPLVNVIIPAFTVFVNVLSRIITAIANVVSMLFGSTIKQSAQAAEGLNKETEALEGVGAAADEASGALAGFDEINQLAGESKDGGGGTAGNNIAPTFDFEEQDTGILDKILNLVKLIGTALLYWKIPAQFRNGLKTLLGLFLALDGAIEFIRNTFDAWVNGVTWDNLLGMLLRAAELVAGLWLVFGRVGAAVGLIVTGLTMLVTGFRDAYENGWNLQNLILSIAGILATGAGIALFTGSWIPMLIAGIAAIVLAITTAYGQGEALLNGIRMILQGFIDFFVGVFTGNIEQAVAGITGIFDGLNIAVTAIFDAIETMIQSFLDWLDEKTGGVLSPIIDTIKNLFSSAFDGIRTTVTNVISAIEQIFTGLVQFIGGVFSGDWDLAWEGIKNIFKGAWNGIVSVIESAINLIISGINKLLDGLQALTAFELPDWLGGYSFKGINIPRISKVSIPRLAQGAVIPPNREFLAVLGDQRSGTNIEAPLDTIKQAVVEAMREVGGQGNGTITVVVNLDGREVARNTVNHINRMTQQAGKPVLNF